MQENIVKVHTSASQVQFLHFQAIPQISDLGSLISAFSIQRLGAASRQWGLAVVRVFCQKKGCWVTCLRCPPVNIKIATPQCAGHTDAMLGVLSAHCGVAILYMLT